MRLSPLYIIALSAWSLSIEAVPLALPPASHESGILSVMPHNTDFSDISFDLIPCGGTGNLLPRLVHDQLAPSGACISGVPHVVAGNDPTAATKKIIFSIMVMPAHNPALRAPSNRQQAFTLIRQIVEDPAFTPNPQQETLAQRLEKVTLLLKQDSDPKLLRICTLLEAIQQTAAQGMGGARLKTMRVSMMLNNPELIDTLWEYIPDLQPIPTTSLVSRLYTWLA